jgi:hypothetical protein
MTRDRTKTNQMARDRTKAEIAASIAEILAGLARMARDQKLTQLLALLDIAIIQAEHDATNERKSTSRASNVA